MSWTKHSDSYAKILYALQDASRLLSEEHVNCGIDQWRYQIAATLAQIDKAMLMFREIAKNSPNLWYEKEAGGWFLKK